MSCMSVWLTRVIYSGYIKVRVLCWEVHGAAACTYSGANFLTGQYTKIKKNNMLAVKLLSPLGRGFRCEQCCMYHMSSSLELHETGWLYDRLDSGLV